MWRKLTRISAATVKNPPHGTAQRGFGGLLIDKGERYGAAFGFGALKGYYGEKFYWHNYSLDLWAGAALTLVSGVGHAVGGSWSKLADHLERVGDAGVQAALTGYGAKWGMRQAGRSVQVLTPGKSAGLPRTRAQGVIGAIPPAQAGPYLSADEIANFAARR